ncbi:hypothetical protein JXA32_03640 [Candidatus Sumerlaeota bacterium]|nr:hypothetical protein [Candidatus Sumerlaeota bacterium]
MAKSRRDNSGSYDPASDPRRGRSFQDIAGHERLMTLLNRMIEQRRLPHSLLFHGPAQIGKRSLAYALIRRMECLKGDAAPGCDCRACVKLQRGSWFDLIEVRPGETGQQVVKVLDMREAMESAVQLPIEGRHRFLLVHGAERMQKESANAFLKTLEEPPPHLHIILLTSRLYSLLPTIRSRCTEARFNPVDWRALAEWLKARTSCDAALREFLAVLSGGCPGLALELAQDEQLSVKREETLAALKQFGEHGYVRLFQSAYEIERQADGDLAQALQHISAWQRDLLIARAAPEYAEQLLVNRQYKNLLMQSAEGCTREAAIEMLGAALKRYDWAGRMLNVQLALENLLLDIGMASKK